MKRWIINIVIIALMICLGYFSFPRLAQRKEAVDEQKVFQQIASTENKANLVKELVKKYNNKDIIGFLEISGTNIKYPVVQRENDNSYYLNHGYDAKYQINGALFLDKNNNIDFTDLNSVIYGHRMASGTLFNQLPKLMENKLFETADIVLTTMDRKETYKVYCIMKVSQDTDYRQTQFTDDDEFHKYLESLIFNSDIRPGKNLNMPPAKILTLSTCTYEHKNYRLVVIGYLKNTEFF